MTIDLRPLYNQANNYRRAQALAPIQNRLTEDLAGIDRQMNDDIAADNRSDRQAVNNAALIGARRQAGGGTFRRGMRVSANQLVSGLGQANARALAASRRQSAQSAAARRRQDALNQVNAGLTPGGSSTTNSGGGAGSYSPGGYGGSGFNLGSLLPNAPAVTIYH